MSKEKRVETLSLRTGSMTVELYEHVMNRIEGRNFKDYAYELFEADMERVRMENQVEKMEKNMRSEIEELKSELKSEMRNEIARQMEDVKDLIRMMAYRTKGVPLSPSYSDVSYLDDMPTEMRIVEKEVETKGFIEEETDFDF